MLAATAAGLCAVGRPTSNGGQNDLAEALAGLPGSTLILVVGENDWKDNDRRCPGRFGAYQVAARQARRVLDLLRIQGDPDGPHGEHVLAYTTWRDAAVRDGFYSWLLSRLMDPAAAGRDPPEALADRFGRWRDFLLHRFPGPLPDHPEVHRTIGPMLDQDPELGDVEAIRAAADLVPVLQEFERCPAPPIPWEISGEGPLADPPPKRRRRPKPDEDAPPYRDRDRVRETIGR